MKCIKCAGMLQEKLVNGVAVDICNQCSGIWFDAGEMDWLVEIYKLAIDDHFNGKHYHLDQRPGHCPRCSSDDKHVPLEQEHGGFNIDTCPFCKGHWLEAGELSALRDQRRYQELLKSVRGE